jgi:hypothetical protein
MKTISKMSSKYGLSLAAALALSTAAAGVARANPIPTTTDEARAFTAAPISQPGATVPLKHAASSTDDARALAGRSVPVSSEDSAERALVTSTDEARVAVCAVTPC